MKTFILLFLLLFSFQAFAQGYTLIRGNAKNESLKKVKFFKIVDGKTAVQATSVVLENDSYGFAFVPDALGFFCPRR